MVISFSDVDKLLQTQQTWGWRLQNVSRKLVVTLLENLIKIFSKCSPLHIFWFYDIPKPIVVLYFGYFTQDTVREDGYLLKILLAACKKAIYYKEVV